MAWNSATGRVMRGQWLLDRAAAGYVTLQPMRNVKHNRSAALAIATVCLLLLNAAAGARADGVDLHWLWDNKCEECHGHSGDFARRNLEAVDGALVGHHDAGQFKLFLTNHYLKGQDLDGIYDMLLAQVGTPPRYTEECRGCHDQASAFVRESIITRGGILVGRKSNTPIEEFLPRHRRLSTQDTGFFTNLLGRVYREIHRP
ncbi:MAG: hypothetical protein DWQ08_06815 [Proteobacteria bacterium]|nr:MAG: hypothetical protein DWQ08_06815 [Pseudomonadota bacterium]